MAKLTRLTGKVFAGQAQLTDLGVFGSAASGTPTNPTAIDTESQLQSGTAYDEGWTSAVITSKNFPPIEEVNAVLRTISYQACYLLQEGAPEYDINTEYSNTSIVKSINGNELSFYISLQNGNKGNSLSDTDYWVKAVFPMLIASQNQLGGIKIGSGLSANTDGTTSVVGKQDIGDWCITSPTTTPSATLNKPAVMVDNYKSGTDGYVVFSDGLTYQWGQIPYNVPASTTPINLKITMADTDYIVMNNRVQGSGNNVKFVKTTTTITPQEPYGGDWLLVGYKAMS